MSDTVAPQRFSTVLITAFGLVSLALALTGNTAWSRIRLLKEREKLAFASH